MPLWSIFHPPTAFTEPTSKQALAQSITNMYVSRGLPAFYVSVNFILVQPDSQFVGGQALQKTLTNKPFVRISIDHIAIRLPETDNAYDGCTGRIDRTLKPHLADKGYDWEYHVTETERRLWKVNGIVPPPWKSPEEKVWRDADYPVLLPGMTRPWLDDEEKEADGKARVVSTTGKGNGGVVGSSNEVVISQREVPADS